MTVIITVTRDRFKMVSFSVMQSSEYLFFFQCKNPGSPNNCHTNIKFTVEFEENNTIPFLRSGLTELRKLLLQNGYPAGIINYNFNDVQNRQQNRTKNPVTTVPKRILS